MAENREMGLDLTKGSIARKMIQFALPFLASSVLQTLYSTVDMVVVGQYVGSVGSVAVSQGSRLTMIFTSLAMGFLLRVRCSSANRPEQKTGKESTKQLAICFPCCCLFQLPAC